MIAKDVFPVYGQYNEDLILAALLKGVKKGFYVDVGANHEEYHSVTKYFYNMGWTGINIEPIPRLIAEFTKKRKKDVNLQIALSNAPGELMLREYPEHDGFSTLHDASKDAAALADLPFRDYTVRVDTLQNILKTHSRGFVDFLKIDVEGYEQEVIEGNDWKQFRPTVICIEANHRSTKWQEILIDHNYVLFISDGLNEYYVAKESFGITAGFAERVALMAHSGVRSHHLEMWKSDLNRIKFLEDFTDRQDALIQSTQKALVELQGSVGTVSSVLKRYRTKLRSVIRSLNR